MRPTSSIALLGIAVGLAILLPLAAADSTPGETVSEELARLFEEDQADRYGGIRGDELRRRDAERRRRVDALLAADRIVEPADRHHAAIIYQHSTEAVDILKAHALASAAAFEGHEKARWLAAASLDRYLTYRDEKQFFGTQFEQDESGTWVPGQTDPALTPSLRQAFDLPSHEELEQRASEWN